MTHDYNFKCILCYIHLFPTNGCDCCDERESFFDGPLEDGTVFLSGYPHHCNVTQLEGSEPFSVAISNQNRYNLKTPQVSNCRQQQSVTAPTLLLLL